MCFKDDKKIEFCHNNVLVYKKNILAKEFSLSGEITVVTGFTSMAGLLPLLH